MSLKSHVLTPTSIRLEFQDLMVYHLTHNIKQKIKEYMITNYTKNEEGQDIIESSFLDISVFRLMISELTNFGSECDTLSDEELEDVINNGDIVIKKMTEEFLLIFEEINLEQKEMFLSIINNVVAVGEQIDLNEKAEKSIDLIANKIGISRETIISMASDSDKLKELQKLLEEENKNKSDNKTIELKDHLPKKEKKKKVTKKKVEVIQDANV